MVAHVLVGIASALENEVPHAGSRQVIRAVQSAHGHARSLLPDLSTYADTVARIARASVSALPLAEL